MFTLKAHPGIKLRKSLRTVNIGGQTRSYTFSLSNRVISQNRSTFLWGDYASLTIAIPHLGIWVSNASINMFISRVLAAHFVFYIIIWRIMFISSNPSTWIRLYQLRRLFGYKQSMHPSHLRELPNVQAKDHTPWTPNHAHKCWIILLSYLTKSVFRTMKTLNKESK